LQKLREDYPNERLIGLFYDPNIHPYSEYQLRLLDVKRSCKMLDIELIEGEYDTISWLKAVEGLEKEPEKGARCAVCFDKRFEVSAQRASDMGESLFTSTLLTSPKKSLIQLKKAGDEIASRYGIEFLAPDYRKASGTQEQNILAKKDRLYRQNYCGCIYGLTMQREQQQRLADELISPISAQIQPQSIEYRLELYTKRGEYEDMGREYTIIKQRFLNYRLLYGYLKVKKQTTPAHFLPHSSIKGDYSRGKVDIEIDGIGYMNRDEVRFITLEYYNSMIDGNYGSITDLIYNPPPFEQEIQLRAKLEPLSYSLSAILVVAKIPQQKVEIVLQSRSYEDMREILR
jgi:predicted adenine nucleotide alpha hydrolase (AANH) superfamily ATPase